VRLAAWPEAYYLIVSLRRRSRPTKRVFRIIDGQVREERLRVVVA
jgi:hypothetical protein